MNQPSSFSASLDNSWCCRPLAELVTFSKGRVVTTFLHEEDGAFPYIGADSFDGAFRQFTRDSTAVLCRASDVLMLWDGERSGLCAKGLAGAIGSTVARLRPRPDVETSFLFHQLDRHFQWIQARRTGTGVPHVPKDLGQTLILPFPSDVVEQQRIAAVLDTVDDAIAKTEAVIAKLKQVRAGLLHDLLTRGLDEHGQLRDPVAHPEQFQDSPLGRIPREWEVTRLGACSAFVTSGSRGWAAYYSQEGAVFLRIGNLTREHINLRLDDVVRVRPPAGGEGARTRVEGGDILISITADLGIIGVIPEGFEEAYVNQHIALVRPGPRLIARWAARFLASGPGATHFRTLNDSGAKAGLNLPAVESLWITVPAYEEQSAASEVLDRIDGDIDAEGTALRKLQHLKSGLLFDLLTGRVRVPEGIMGVPP